MTQVDGIQTSEQFDFGPFSVHQLALDLDALKSVEIVRSSNSALYGSDALGGVVSLFTKDPGDYLRGRRFHIGAKTTWNGRAGDISGNLSLAGGTERLQASLFASFNRGNEVRNKGTVKTRDATRTAANPQDVRGTQLLGKLVFTASPGNMWRVAAEVYDTRVETTWFSDMGLTQLGPFLYDTLDSVAVDTQGRQRLSLDHTLVDRAGLDQLSWRIYGQRNDTLQVVDRERMTFGFGPPIHSTRHETVEYEQVGYGGSVRGQKRLGGPSNGVLVTFGASYQTDTFDILRDRSELNVRTAVPVPTSLIFPSKYFPESDCRRVRYVRPGALLHGPEQIADLPVPVGESPGAVSIGHTERGHLVEYLAPNSVFNSLPRQRSSPHLGPHDRLVTIDRVLHHASLGAA